MFSIKELSMIYGDRVLFYDASLNFSKRQKYGLVGANGAGKTTFLKILSGQLEPTSGSVQIPKDAQVGILDQNYFRFGDTPILDLVLMGNQKLWQMLKKKEAILVKEVLSEKEMEALSELEASIVMWGGYRAEAKAAQILSGLGIDASRHDKPLSTLSGGYKLRVLLSQLLFNEPDLLLLDEPTNYLDIFSIRWLENYLIDYPGTLILSSHDRYFLNRVCQHIVDIDYSEIRSYRGDFDQFIQEKGKEVEMKNATLASYTKKKKEIQRFIDRFKAKASKARQAGSRARMIEKLEEEEKKYEQLPSSREYPQIHFPIERNSGQKVLKVQEISKAFSEHQVLEKIAFEVDKQEKVALVGVNGIGKSTLLEILTGHVESDKGEYQWGLHANWAYFPQNFHRLLNSEASLYDWLQSVSKHLPEEQVRRALGQMLFDEYDQCKKVKALSGGEAARLVFASLALQKPAVLILDEPTNHLDMESTEALIKALRDYKGTLLMVSHNRYFISQVANRIVELHNGRVEDFSGGYDAFVKKHERDYLDRKKAPSFQEKKRLSGEKKEEKRQRNRLKRDIERLEKEIAELETHLERINQTLAAPHFYTQSTENEQQEVLSERVLLEKKQEELYKKWEDNLSELEKT